MATAAGLGCSREERRLGFYRQCALARGITTITHVKGWHDVRAQGGVRAVWRADVALQSSRAPRVPTLIQLSTV
jgi:hypothetical protein